MNVKIVQGSEGVKEKGQSAREEECLPSDPLRTSRLRRACGVEAIGGLEKFPGASPPLCHTGPRECLDSKHVKAIAGGY